MVPDSDAGRGVAVQADCALIFKAGHCNVFLFMGFSPGSNTFTAMVGPAGSFLFVFHFVADNPDPRRAQGEFLAAAEVATAIGTTVAFRPSRVLPGQFVPSAPWLTPAAGPRSEGHGTNTVWHERVSLGAKSQNATSTAGAAQVYTSGTPCSPPSTWGVVGSSKGQRRTDCSSAEEGGFRPSSCQLTTLLSAGNSQHRATEKIQRAPHRPSQPAC